MIDNSYHFILTPTIGAWINTYILSEERAIIISLRGTLVLPFSAIGMAVMGVLSDIGSPKLAYFFGLSTILATIPIYAKISEKGNNR